MAEYPVLWSRNQVGHASTERGALAVVARFPVERRERRTATLATDLDGQLTWFCGRQLVTARERTARRG